MANTNDANDAARIAENLKRFGWSPIGFADFAAWVALQFGQTEPEEPCSPGKCEMDEGVALQFGQTEPEELESDNNSTVREV